MAVPGTRRARAGRVLHSSWFTVSAAVAAVAALVTGAVLANGYDLVQTKVGDSSVWALQAGDGDRYARVNTSLGELETIESVSNPSDLAQSSDHVLVYAQNNARVASVSLSQPADLENDSADFESTPAGTAKVVHTGDFVGYLTGAGGVLAGRMSAAAGDGPDRVTPPGTKSVSSYSADAIAIGTDGILYAYSHASGTVLRYDIRTQRVTGTDAVADGPSGSQLQLTVVGDTWVLTTSDAKSMWIAGRAHVLSTGVGASAKLQQPSSARKSVIVADATGLRSIQLGSGTVTRVATSERGTPAAPTWSGQRLYAAWVGGSAGEFWVGRATLSGVPSGARTAKALDPGDPGQDSRLTASVAPVFRSNGGGIILNESVSGWVWTMPAGKIVQGSQKWDLTDDTSKTTTTQKDDSAKVTDPRPPVAVGDRFGVRAGALVTLPVLANDYDPNDDVLSIVTDSVKGLDSAFGAVSLANGAQTLTVQVAANPPPTATFSYVITDGTAGDGGLRSQAATVTLELHAASVNAAPALGAGDPGALDSYGAPDAVTVGRGDTVSVPALRGWGDPDGDPIFATIQQDASASAQQDYSVSLAPSGTLVFKADADAQARPISIDYDITDISGRSVSRTIKVTISANPTLTVENFGLMTAQDVPITVDPSAHIRGAQGSVKIRSVTTSASSDVARATVDSSGTTFTFSASVAGSYPLAMTVGDGHSTHTATVRIIVVPKNQPLLSTAPVTVFVRPQTDTSVDVFSAVQNPTGRVLLLSDPKPQPAAGASLDVDVVGEAQLRVRGVTADAQPGVLGTVGYTVSDGTGASNLTVQGLATVYLLPDSLVSRPVAVDDSATVRAGSQVDIPVLANDVAANGDTVQLDAASVQNPGAEGLAFASGETLRYLAPKTSSGMTVVLRYNAYSAGEPDAKSPATVTITVLPVGGDRAPQPATLTGRVIAGASVSIPFSDYGIDPDGDAVALDRITQQPAQGSARISADGSAIVYTSVAGTSQQQKFSYEVRDAYGGTGTATVVVGVLDGQSDPAPVTFSDYVQVQAGAGNKVIVQPVANDIDPLGGTLKLSTVTPNAIVHTAQYRQLARQLSRNGNEVVVTATAVPRTLTYTYTVTNSRGDVAAGLIVVKVVSGFVANYPVASDTVVGTEQRAQLRTGLDVVSGKVSWGAGAVAQLKLSLWHPSAGVSVSGHRIRVATVPADGLLVPFELSGVDFTGHRSTTYGFLRIPAAADVILALKDGAPALHADEGGSGRYDFAKWVTVPQGDQLVVDQGKARVSKTRAGASCSVEGTVVTYVAGDGAPWVDSCRVDVRLLGQRDDTLLAVPVTVTPREPEPQLRSASLTVSPGAGALSYALTRMTTWLGHADLSDLHYTYSYSGSLFELAQNGQELVVRAHDDAGAGREEQVKVSIAGYPGSATITLKVGPAPSSLPSGGSAKLSCSESQGSSCETTVVGLPNEVNDLPGTPLKVVDVDATVGGCDGVTFSVARARAIVAKWADGTPGGNCAVSFDVEEAQGKRNAAGSGAGTLTFQLQGYPAAPASVSQIGYSADSVTLAVIPGTASAAFPALRGFHVFLGGKVVATCDAQGVCPAISGQKNGAKQTFTVRAFNSVGDSKSSTGIVAWAFGQPVLSGISAAPVYDATSQTQGVFKLTIPNSDASASRYKVVVGGVAQPVLTAAAGRTTTAEYTAAPGETTTVTVTPISAFDVPPGQATDARPATTTVVTAGLPRLGWSPLPASFTTTTSSISISGSGSGRFDPDGSTLPESVLYAAVPVGGDPGCTFDRSASTQLGVTSTAIVSHGRAHTRISGVTAYQSYDVYACYSNGYGAAKLKLNSAAVTAWEKPDAPSGWTYDIENRAGSGLPDYEFTRAPASSESVPSGYRPVLSPSDYGKGAFGQSPSITVRYCASDGESFCSDSSAVRAARASAPFQLRVDSVAAQCTVTDDQASLGMSVSGDGVGVAGPTIVPLRYSYIDAADPRGSSAPRRTADVADGPIPRGAVSVIVTAYRITFATSGFADYAPTSADVSAGTSCDTTPATSPFGSGADNGTSAGSGTGN